MILCSWPIEGLADGWLLLGNRLFTRDENRVLRSLTSKTHGLPPAYFRGIMVLNVHQSQCFPLFPKQFALRPPRFHFGRVSTLCPPCVRLASAVRPPCVRLAPASCPPGVRFGRASKPCPPCVCLLCLPCVCPPCARSLSAQVHHVSSPLDFVRQGRGIMKQNYFSALRNPPRLYCMPAGQFPWHSFWLPKFGLCKRTLYLKNCLGSMLVYFFTSLCVSDASFPSCRASKVHITMAETILSGSIPIGPIVSSASS